MQISEFYQGKRILLTGHTGFKGRWLAAWLGQWQASIAGLSLDPEEFEPNDPVRKCRRLVAGVQSAVWGDIRDADLVNDAFRRIDPEIVFHLAAQPLVRESYRDPAATFATNVMGVANVLEAARRCASTRVVIVVTSDKCYAPAGEARAHKEDDKLGGHDPYSASKACAEIVTQSYARSFLHDRDCAVATVRAGNVIGGGDWADDRLVPDIIRSLARRQPVVLRHPMAVRPWQHVLAPLSGYIRLAARAWSSAEEFSGAWNFGPRQDDHIPVGQLARELLRRWGGGEIMTENSAENAMPESHYLGLDSSKAEQQLGWRPHWNIDQTLDSCVEWYRSALAGDAEPDQLMRRQISQYLDAARTTVPQTASTAA